MPEEARGIRSFVAGVTGGYELPNLGTWNQIQMLWRVANTLNH